jgi:hypothetical protein
MKQFAVAAFVCAATFAWASDHQKWLSTDYTQWTSSEREQILNDSPWARQATAFFGTTDEDARTYPVQMPTPRDAGLGGRAVSDGSWDGGVGRIPRGGTPTLPVTVRWDSALPVREALFASHSPDNRDTEHTLAQPDKYYVIAVIGLARGRQPAPADPDGPDSDAVNQQRTPFDMTQTRQGLMNFSRLTVKGKKPIVPEDVRVDEATGRIQVFFPKSDPITMSDKEVYFTTTYGSIKVTQRFRLKDMTYKGKLEL